MWYFLNKKKRTQSRKGSQRDFFIVAFAVFIEKNEILLNANTIYKAERFR